jgi:hypothetical protein
LEYFIHNRSGHALVTVGPIIIPTDSSAGETDESDLYDDDDDEDGSEEQCSLKMSSYNLILKQF